MHFWHHVGKNFQISWWCMNHWEYIQPPRCGERYSTEPGSLTAVSTKKCRNLSFQVKNTCMTIWGFGGVSFKSLFSAFSISSMLLKSFKTNYSTADRSPPFKVIIPSSALFIWIFYFRCDNVFTLCILSRFMSFHLFWCRKKLEGILSNLLKGAI